MSMQYSPLTDLAIRGAIAARLGGMKRAQVSKLLEVAWSARESELFEELSLYIARQISRREFDRDAARYLIMGLNELRKQDKLSREEVARFIGLFRWAYDSMEGIRLRIRREHIRNMTFDGFLREIGLL